jgi:hypothetical protein
LHISLATTDITITTITGLLENGYLGSSDSILITAIGHTTTVQVGEVGLGDGGRDTSMGVLVWM